MKTPKIKMLFSIVALFIGLQGLKAQEFEPFAYGLGKGSKSTLEHSLAEMYKAKGMKFEFYVVTSSDSSHEKGFLILRSRNEEQTRHVVYFKAKKSLQQMFNDNRNVKYKKEDFELLEVKLDRSQNLMVLSILNRWRTAILKSQYINYEQYKRVDGGKLVIVTVNYARYKYAKVCVRIIERVDNDVLAQILKVIQDKNFKAVTKPTTTEKTDTSKTQRVSP